MANLIILISKAMACMNRVDSVFQVKSSIEDGSFAGVGGEAVSRVCLLYTSRCV